MVKRLDAEHMGCAPVGDRSTIESRLCPRATPNSGSIQWPSASGPRGARELVMRLSADRCAAAVPLSGRQKPAIPHMATLRDVPYRHGFDRQHTFEGFAVWDELNNEGNTRRAHRQAPIARLPWCRDAAGTATLC